ncbi:hypothetical protein [Devosia sp.]|uniref:hypothetical protein n=1 Tax=Devosia sp. TaxID=1871048 RepID=UPI002FC84DCD
MGRADTLLLGRVTYQAMEGAWRLATRTATLPDWMEPFARTIDAMKKYVVSQDCPPRIEMIMVQGRCSRLFGAR